MKRPLFVVGLILLFSQVQAQTMLKKQYSLPGMSIEPFCLSGDGADGYLIAGNYFLPALDTYIAKTTCFIRVDKTGCVSWASSMTQGRLEVIQSILATSDSGFLVSGFPYQSRNSNYPDSLFIFKLDKQGNRIWANAYQEGLSDANFLSAMCETEDKGYVIEAGSFSSGDKESFLSLIKIDAAGNYLWGKKYGIENNATYTVGGIIEKNGFIYTTGSINKGDISHQVLRSFLIKLVARTGQTVWTKQYDATQYTLSFTDLHLFNNGILINSFDENNLHHLLYTDYDGNVLASPIVNNPYGSSNGGQDIQVNNDNSIYIHQSSGQLAGNPKEIIARLNGNLQMVWQYDFYSPDRSFDGWYQLSSAAGNGIAAIGSGIARGAERALAFLMMDPTGSLCNAGPTALTLSSVNSTLIPLTWNTDASLPFDVSEIPRSLNSLTITSRLFCSQQTICCELNNSGSKLPKDTALCMGSSMVLNAPPGYESYQWQNGSGGQSIRVSTPGIYWVRLTYENGSCRSTDSVAVSSKDCSTNIFFPGAFTPNKDGKNELFKPAITGEMLKYHFVIYNRWGQQIFETSDPLKGWNGSNAGEDQAGGVYVWYCNYQFTGQKENVTKGTCLLIR